MRPTYEIPAAPQSARPFATEEASVRAVRAVLQGAGFPVDDVETSVEFNPVSDLPTLRGETVVVPRWLTPDADVAVRLAALLESTLGVTVDLNGWSDADAQAAWSALQVAQLTDQIMRVLDQSMGVPPDLSDPGALDRRVGQGPHRPRDREARPPPGPPRTGAFWRRWYPACPPIRPWSCSTRSTARTTP